MHWLWQAMEPVPVVSSQLSLEELACSVLQVLTSVHVWQALGLKVVQGSSLLGGLPPLVPG